MSEYACKCLNVRVRPGSAAQQQQQRPEQSASSAAAAAPLRDPFVPATVAADGISVVHNQLTQRIRSRARPLSSEADELQRCMSLRCLICGMTVYRVSQVIPPDMDAPEGPVHTADDWVEDTALTSNDGLIEVSLDCLDAAKVKDAERSPQYSPFFRVLIPPAPTRPDPPQVPHSPFAADGEAPSLPSPPLTPHLFEETEAEHARPYRALPLSQPLFPPAPFTPSHPVFVHLSSVALRRSHEIRLAADDFLSRLIADKLQEVTREEAALRAQVQALWATFRAAQADTEPASAPSMQAAAAPAVSSPIRGRDETFAPPAARRTASPPRSSSRPKSALSASLSTSSFHHPRASSSRSDSTTSSSFSSTRPLDDTHSVVRGSFRRNLSEDKDVATSFKYSLDIATEMEKRTGMRTKRRDASAEEEEKSAADGASVQSPPPVMTKQATARSPPPKKTKAENKDEAAEAERLSPGKAKVKRKVTFDIQTPVKEEAPANGHAGVDDAVIFDLEDETGGERFEPFGEPSTTEALPLNEPPPPHVPRRPSNKRAGSSESGLSQSFSLLRPASLPKPSLLRFASSPPGAASKLSSPLSLQTQSPPQAQAQGKTNRRAELPEPLTPREEALARLVAADTPSHRAAWKKDGKAWEVFNGRSSIRDPLDDETDEEDEEDTLGPLPSPRSNGKQIPRTGESDWDPPVAASLPIAIDTTRNRTPSGGLTYQPKTSLSDNYGQVVPALHAPGSKGGTYTSPAALRRAAYAERDIARSMDPGALDFLQGEDDEDEGEDGVDAGSRGKQNALKILKARSQLPSEGMWRSLAT